ncbi:P-loop containing nucleoside triphosphate hydrolase protein, partial [Jimgerdemannia flammicorona]
MRFVCLRRTKDMRFDGRAILALPTIESFLHRVQFSDEARNRYRLLEDEAKKLYREFRKSKAGADADAEEQGAVKKYSNLLAALTRLRQCCDHHCLVGSTLKTILEGQAADTIDMERLLYLLGDAIQRCHHALPTRLRPRLAYVSPYPTTSCTPSLRNDRTTTNPLPFIISVCIQKVLDTNPICPMCRGAIKLTQLVDPPLPPPELEGDADADSFETADQVEAGGFESSPKIDALLEFLKASQAKDRTTKSVVFSQWTSFLDVVGKALRKAGFHHVRLDGKMQRKKRDEAIASFQRDPEITVFLISLKCGSLGLNLTAANQCFLLDPYRIYRLGQTRPVKVFRFVIEDTIEDRVMELQEKKRKMAEQALGEKGKANDKTREG